LKSTFIAALTGAIALIATPALADHRGGGHDHGPQTQAEIGQERALEIARGQGVATVDEIKLDEGLWEIEGRTSEGRRIEVEINAQNGAIVKRELY